MKLIAIDLDGTLLNSDHQLLSENINAVRKAQSKGMKIVIATGRSVLSTVEIIDHMDINAYILALNGTFIAERKDKKELRFIKSSVLEKENVKKAFQIALDENITFIASNEYGSDRVVVEDGQELVQEFMTVRPDLKRFSAAQMKEKLNDNSIQYMKVAFTNRNRDKLIQLKEKLRKNGIETIFSDTFYIEYVPDGVNKGTSLEYLCNEIGVDMSDTVAIGDQENDLEMLKMSGIGIAMGNAQEHIKNIANRVTDTNDCYGVAKAIDSLL